MRVVVGLAEGHDPRQVGEQLKARGARHVQGPQPSLPDVLVADFPEDDMPATLERVSALPGVRYAEPDELQSAF
jgi:fervidolysin-like protein